MVVVLAVACGVGFLGILKAPRRGVFARRFNAGAPNSTRSGWWDSRLRASPSSSIQVEPLLSKEQVHPAVSAKVLTFQQAIQRLQEYWSLQGCAVVQPCNTEVGAGTMNPATFLRVLGPEPWNVAYVEPSVRPDDSRYGENPNRVQQHTQFQVILKPDPGNAQELYLGSLSAIGIDTSAHDIRFVEDNWESPVLGAWGLGWEVWMDGMEITQFTYFQQAGSLSLLPVSVEITYGLERILMALQGVDHFKKIQYSAGVTYGELFLENEKEMSMYNLDHADVERSRSLFDIYEAEAHSLLKKGLAIPAYSYLLKASHVFNVLDARGEVGVAQRADYFGRMRRLTRSCAQLWMKTREQLNHPLGVCETYPERQLPAETVSAAVRQVTQPETFLLEIGSEELPPDDVISAIAQLKAAIPELLEKIKLSHEGITVDGTPRRITVVVNKLSPKQDDAEVDVKGPPVSKAYDSDGNPTKALEGFCKRNGVTLDQVRRVEGKVDYVTATVQVKGRHSIEALAEELPSLIASIRFSKSMKWRSEVEYSRPLRWIVALLGEAVVPFSYATVESNRFSRVLRTSSSDSVRVPKADDYIKSLKEAGITLGMQERAKEIWSKDTLLAASIHGKLFEEDRDSLLDEVANLVEKPLPLLGSFDKAFLELPAEVLTTVMRKHQRYFPVKDVTTDELLPAFIVVANGNVQEDVVRNGNEAVLRARYEDAKFFYGKDILNSLESYRPSLSGIVFHEKLGSMLDKSKRVEKLVSKLAELLDLNEPDVATANEAAALANADLGTYIVKEFTSLAGVMGRHYAIRDGKSIEVADAVFEMLLPRFASDRLPESDAGRLLSLADKLDSLAGLFPVVGKPSTAGDSYNLRRTAYGLVNILVQSGKDLDVRKAIQVAADVQPLAVSSASQQELLLFITRRLEQLLVDGGSDVEFVRAVLAERGHRPTLAASSVSQLEEVFKEGILAKVVEAYSRPTRIVKGKEMGPSSELDESLFVDPEEGALWQVYKSVAEQVHEEVGVDDFVKSSQALIDPLQSYFNKVFVMDKDDKIRHNRLSMLQRIAQLPTGIVDFSVLPGF